MEEIEIINTIKAKWESKEMYELIKEFDEAPVGAATGGEAMAIISKFLNDLRVTNPAGFHAAEDSIEQFIKKCEVYRIFIRRDIK